MTALAMLKNVDASLSPYQSLGERDRIRRGDDAVASTPPQEEIMRYKVVLHRTDEGISVSVPASRAAGRKVTAMQRHWRTCGMQSASYLAALDDQFQSADVREVEVAV